MWSEKEKSAKSKLHVVVESISICREHLGTEGGIKTLYIWHIDHTVHYRASVEKKSVYKMSYDHVC